MSWTKKPCDGCHENRGRREVGEVCRQCKAVMTAGHDAIAARSADPDQVVTSFSEATHWAGMPRIFVSSGRPLSEARIDDKILAKTLLEFLWALGQPVAGSDWDERVQQLPGVPLHGVKWLGGSESHRGAPVLVPRGVAERITRLRDAIALHLEYAHCAGWHAGASILNALASGDLGLDAEAERRTRNTDRLEALAVLINTLDPIEELESGAARNARFRR